MPSYTFVNPTTKERKESGYISFRECDEFLAANPGWEILPAAVQYGDNVRLGRLKPSEGFRDVLRTLKKKNKGSTINTF